VWTTTAHSSKKPLQNKGFSALDKCLALCRANRTYHLGYDYVTDHGFTARQFDRHIGHMDVTYTTKELFGHIGL
jgi:hypothetical protein